MLFFHLNILKNRLIKILNSLVSFIGVILKKTFNKVLFKDQGIIYDKDGLEYWKSRIFYILSIFFIICGAPLLFYGAYLFYMEGTVAEAITEASVYIIIILVITQKSLSLRLRKLFVVLILYFISLFILISTGVMGAGMVCILFTLILSGCLLDKRQAYLVITINLVIFIALTELLIHGNFDGTNMEVYKKVWFINAITTQVCGILLFFIMNTIYMGLENQIKERIIKEEKILYLNYHDSLTGLYNRAFFEKEIERLDTESQLPLSVITGDINGLKLINDSFGHAEGDKLLISVSKILENCCRKADIIARIGGDEFNILLPRTSSEVTYGIIENINSSCEEYNKKVTRELNYTSISLGSATKISIEEPLDTIFKVAEDYMYKRKLLESRSIHSYIISSMKTVLFEKSQETEEHAQRLVKLSRAVGEAIGLTSEQFDELELFSTLHDIGKISVDDQILNKPGKLTDKEWFEMRKHSEVGYRIAMSSPELMSIANYILTHHERFDGNGYPQGLAGDNIPLLSRILAVVDAYDAMTEDRPYRKGMLKQEAIAEIMKNEGTQFDPEVSKIFIKIISNENILIVKP